MNRVLAYLALLVSLPQRLYDWFWGYDAYLGEESRPETWQPQRARDLIGAPLWDWGCLLTLRGGGFRLLLARVLMFVDQRRGDVLWFPLFWLEWDREEPDRLLLKLAGPPAYQPLYGVLTVNIALSLARAREQGLLAHEWQPCGIATVKEEDPPFALNCATTPDASDESESSATP